MKRFASVLLSSDHRDQCSFFRRGNAVGYHRKCAGTQQLGMARRNPPL